MHERLSASLAQGVLYSSTLFLGISNCLTVQHLVSAQRTVFYRWVGRSACCWSGDDVPQGRLSCSVRKDSNAPPMRCVN